MNVDPATGDASMPMEVYRPHFEDNMNNHELPDLSPLGDRLLIQQHSDEQKSSLVIPEESKGEMKQAFGMVIGIGGGEEVCKLHLCVGDTVYFNKFAGERIKFEDKEYLILKSSEVLARVNKIINR